MENQQQGDSQLPRTLRAVLEAMPDSERKKFGQFLGFEHFNSQKRLHDLYLLVEAHFFSPKPPKQSWESQLKQAKINEGQLNKLMTFLHQKLDQYLAMQQVQLMQHRHIGYGLEAYHHLKVDFPNTEKRLRQWQKKLQGDAQSIEHLQQLINLEHFAIKVRITANAKNEESYFSDIHLLLDQHYLVAKLKYTCAAINEAKFTSRAYPQDELDRLTQYLKGQQVPLPPIGRAYSLIFYLILEPQQSIDNFKDCLAQLIEMQPAIDAEDVFDLFNYLLNLSYPRLNSLDPGFENLVAQIYQVMLDLNLLITNGEIPSRTFKNVVSLNCKQGNFEWTRQFIREQNSALPKEDIEAVTTYCLALVDFYEGKHEAAIPSFKKVIQLDTEDHLWGFESRNLLLKSYFELYEKLSLEENEDFFKLIDSFRMYVRRNSKLDDYMQNCYLNFIQFLTAMVRHVDLNGKDSPYPGKLLESIKAEEHISNKAWMLAQF